MREVQNGVELARSLGLSVIVSVQAEGPAGLSSRCPLPDTGTERVWTELASMFEDDPGVMFELYNEPGLSGDRAQLAAVAQRRHADAEQRIALARRSACSHSST